jgi:hypothetical protein
MYLTIVWYLLVICSHMHTRVCRAHEENLTPTFPMTAGNAIKFGFHNRSVVKLYHVNGQESHQQAWLIKRNTSRPTNRAKAEDFTGSRVLSYFKDAVKSTQGRA